MAITFPTTFQNRIAPAFGSSRARAHQPCQNYPTRDCLSDYFANTNANQQFGRFWGDCLSSPRRCEPSPCNYEQALSQNWNCQTPEPKSPQKDKGMMWVPFMGGDPARPGQVMKSHQETKDDGRGNVRQHTTFDTATGNQVKDMVSTYNRESGETFTVQTTADGRKAYLRTRVENGQTIVDISGDESVTRGVKRQTITYNGTSFDATDTMQDGSQRTVRSNNATEQTPFRQIQATADGSYTMANSPDLKIGTQTWLPGTSPTSINTVL